MKPITQNTLFYGDNLPILREYIPDESVDLVYLDPPFNSNRSYNVLFKDESGSSSDAQIAAFDDTWHWGPSAEQIYDDADAHQLAQDDRYQFQWWALSIIQAMPLGGAEGKKEGKKGADRGIDGVINFIDDPKGKISQVLVQVKSGKVNSSHIRDLRGVLEREKAAIGVFITLEPPTADMTTEAVSAGYYTSPIYQQKYPKLQILCIEDLLAGAKVKMPPTASTFKKAERVKKVVAEQRSMLE